MSVRIGYETALPILQAGGYLQRRDERKTKRKCAKLTTRLYTHDGIDLGVANFTRRRLIALCKIKEVRGPNDEQRWVLK